MTSFVLDASVTMRWFFEAGSHPYADAILRQLVAASSDALVPILWRYEVSAVLARAQIKDTSLAQDAADFIEDLEALPTNIDGDSGASIFSSCHRLAVAHRLTSFDAAYLELALRRSLPVATLDAELIEACVRAGVPLL